MGGVENCKHLQKSRPFYAEEPLELGVAGCQCFLNAFGSDEHCRQKKEKVNLTDNSNFSKIKQYQNTCSVQKKLENRSNDFLPSGRCE